MINDGWFPSRGKRKEREKKSRRRKKKEEEEKSRKRVLSDFAVVISKNDRCFVKRDCDGWPKCTKIINHVHKTG